MTIIGQCAEAQLQLESFNRSRERFSLQKLLHDEIMETQCFFVKRHMSIATEDARVPKPGGEIVLEKYSMKALKVETSKILPLQIHDKTHGLPGWSMQSIPYLLNEVDPGERCTLSRQIATERSKFKRLGKQPMFFELERMNSAVCCFLCANIENQSLGVGQLEMRRLVHAYTQLCSF